MTHVWQAQTRGRFYLVLMRHPFCRYGYQMIEGRRFDVGDADVGPMGREF